MYGVDRNTRPQSTPISRLTANPQTLLRKPIPYGGRALAGCQEQIIYWLLHGNILNSSLNFKVFPALSEQYQSTSHMHISKQIFPSTLKDSREPDGKTTEQHVTNMGCEVGRTWAWIQVALLPCKLLHFPELHMSRVILSPSAAFSFHGVITFCRELNPHDL